MQAVRNFSFLLVMAAQTPPQQSSLFPCACLGLALLFHIRRANQQANNAFRLIRKGRTPAQVPSVASVGAAPQANFALPICRSIRIPKQLHKIAEILRMKRAAPAEIEALVSGKAGIASPKRVEVFATSGRPDDPDRLRN